MRLKSPAGRRVATTGRLRPRFHIRCRNTGALKSLPSREKKCSVHDTVQCRKPVGKVGGGGTLPVKVPQPQVLPEPKVVAGSALHGKEVDTKKHLFPPEDMWVPTSNRSNAMKMKAYVDN